MGLLTIGAFSRASRLSPKALRLYDELGLLVPAHVDPHSGYRFYEPSQLERARLVAWLRRLGMPLARIRAVCDLAPEEAAHEVRAFWAQVEADTSARRDLAAFLIHHLSWKESDMPAASKQGEIRHAALSDAGLVRESNQDAAYAGSHLFAVADGFGSEGKIASRAAIDALKDLDSGSPPAGDLLNLLEDAVAGVTQAVYEATRSAPSPKQTGTTLTAMLWTGSQFALVHIGDSRVYVLRDGELDQITDDHTLVQAMVDEGRITSDEVAAHPQRALLARALNGRGEAVPDIRLHDAEAGDRYLLCSDGLSAVVGSDAVRNVLATIADPEAAVHELVALAHRSGAPDNIACVIADVIT